MNRVRRLAAVIELILTYHPKGLRVLVGECEPTTAELAEILQCVCDSGPDVSPRVAAAFPTSPQERALISVDTILDIVAEGGGWAGIAAMARQFREVRSEDWAIFHAHVLWVKPCGASRIGQDPVLLRIADKFGVCPDTVTRKREAVVYEIAKYAIMTDGGFMADRVLSA